MRVLLIYAHPLDDSFCAALKDAALRTLVTAGHEVEVLDLYARNFDPVLSADERRGYHDLETNRNTVEDEVAQLQRADGLVLVYPVWNFGYPAILKGYFDRVFLPGVSFRMKSGRVVADLHHIRRLFAITTYGGSRARAFLVGDPPRKLVCRVLRGLIAPSARLAYLALYDMNRTDQAKRSAFLEKVSTRLAKF